MDKITVYQLWDEKGNHIVTLDCTEKELKFWMKEFEAADSSEVDEDELGK